MDMINIFCINTFTFMLACKLIQFKGPSREICRLLSETFNQREDQTGNKLSNVKVGLKNAFFIKKCLLFLSG